MLAYGGMFIEVESLKKNIFTIENGFSIKTLDINI